jgi:iron complex transport system permease protein
MGYVVLGSLVAALFLGSLMIGERFYPLTDVVRVVLGEQVPGASFTVGELRLPRAVAGVLAGFAFGVAGATTQTLLRNPLASPDIIGISQGASAGAVIAIVFFSLSDAAVSLAAFGGALTTALAIYFLSYKGAFQGTRLILIGIGVAAMLSSVISYALSKAAAWDIQAAMRWMTGSLNGVSWSQIAPLALVSLLLPVVLLQHRNLEALRLGADSATALGVQVERSRVVLLFGAVILLAFATSVAGPVAFVAFMSGPIAARLIRPGANLLVPAGCVGAILVLAADLIGQFAFPTRYPVGVITGLLGAPYLVFLLIRTNQGGRSL